MPTCNDSIIHTDPSPKPPSSAPTPAPLPSWLCQSNPNPRPQYSPSVTLTLSPSNLPPRCSPDRPQSTTMPPHHLANLPRCSPARVGPEILQCYKELEESRCLLEAHKKEAAWRQRRTELLLESEKARRKRQKIEEIEVQIKAIKEEEKVSLERIEMEYREQLADLRCESEAKEHKLSEQWASKHLRLTKCLQQVDSGARLPKANARRI